VQLEAWLRKQPREVAVAFAARAALRVLPMVQPARKAGFEFDFLAKTVLPVFCATAVAWAAAKYPAQPVFRAAARPARDADRVAARAAALAADAYGVHAADLWEAVSDDTWCVETGQTASIIAGLPLRPFRDPVQLLSLWQELKAALLAARQDWQVWTIWYDHRLDGRVRGEERELAYVRIKEALWKQGPAIVNAEIRRLIEEHGPPAPIENVPSAVSYGWSSKGTITVVPGPQNWPVFPFQGGERDHPNRLEASRVLAKDTARSLRNGKWNVRSEYGETLDDYVAYLPRDPEEGNFLLADAQARIIRAMFAAEQDFLPSPLAAKLKVLLEQHIGLRAYYPTTEDFYESVRTGHLETPLPLDAVEGFLHGVRDNTPTLFETNVSQSLEGVARPIPTVAPANAEAPKSDSAQPAPPLDPLGEVDPEKARRFTLGSAVNALWKAVLSGDQADKTVEGWSEVIAILGPKVVPILEWLRSVL